MPPFSHATCPSDFAEPCTCAHSAQNRTHKVAHNMPALWLVPYSTAIEHPKQFGRRGFDSHRAPNFDGPMNWVIGKSGRKPQAGSNPVQPGKLVDDPTRLLSVINRAGPLCFGYRMVAQLRKSSPREREDTGSIPVRKHRSSSLPVPHRDFIGPKVVGYLTQR